MTHRFLKKVEGCGVAAKTGNNSTSADGVHQETDYNPNMVVYRKMEAILDSMQDEHTGISVKTVKSFMSKIPSVFTGASLVSWISRNICCDDLGEALHLAHLIAAHGYLFPIDDHILTAKNDNTYYRFQTPCFWPSKCGDPENTDYAVYLCKRTMQNKQRLELADYEAENLARLQKMFSRKWEFIFMQAEAQAKVDKKRDKMERKILDSQERAFWDLHRPAPGCVNTTEVDIKKACRMTKVIQNPSANAAASKTVLLSEAELKLAADRLKAEIQCLQSRLEKRRIKVSKCAESFQLFFEQYAEYDPFITTCEPSNPWIADSVEFWEQENSQKEIPQRRVKKWAFSIQELLRDPAGREHFARYLEREFSKENLTFWEACQDLKWCPERQVRSKVLRIYSEFLAQGARDPVNVDCRVAELVRTKVENNPSRWCFDEAEEHIFKLMRNDTYNRYLRSDLYKEFLSGTKKKSIRRWFTSEPQT